MVYYLKIEGKSQLSEKCYRVLHLCHEFKHTTELKVCVNIYSHSYIFVTILDLTDSLGFVF